MSTMKLWRYEGKNVRITTDCGHEFVGMAYDYTSALDNPNNIASISIGDVEAILSKGDRAEVIPTKDGPKVVRIKRDPVKI